MCSVFVVSNRLHLLKKKKKIHRKVHGPLRAHHSMLHKMARSNWSVFFVPCPCCRVRINQTVLSQGEAIASAEGSSVK